MNWTNAEWAILGVGLMKPSRRVLGKMFTYLGLFLTGMGMIGILGPYLELQRSHKIMAQVVSNDIAHQQPGAYGFRLQLKWDRPEGEQRTTITTVVRAKSEAEARESYRGKHLAAGQTYEFYTDPENPDRIQPFKGYNPATFGKFIAITLAGVVVFFVGMSIVRGQKKEKR